MKLTLKEAIEQQADIVCGSVEERDMVVEACKRHGLPANTWQSLYNSNGLIVALSPKHYTIDDVMAAGDWPQIKASNLTDLTPANDIYDVSDMD